MSDNTNKGELLMQIEALQAQIEELTADFVKQLDELSQANYKYRFENNELKAQVEQLRSPLRNLINFEHERGGSLQVDGQFAYRVKEQIFKDAKNALDKTPAQCLREIKAQVVELTTTAYNEVIEFTVNKRDLDFLDCWNEGDWIALNDEWPEFNLFSEAQINLMKESGFNPEFLSQAAKE